MSAGRSRKETSTNLKATGESRRSKSASNRGKNPQSLLTTKKSISSSHHSLSAQERREERERKRREEQEAAGKWTDSLRNELHSNVANFACSEKEAASEKPPRMSAKEWRGWKEEKVKEDKAIKSEWTGSLRSEVHKDGGKGWVSPELPMTNKRIRTKMGKLEMKTKDEERKEAAKKEKEVEGAWMGSLRPDSGFSKDSQVSSDRLPKPTKEPPVVKRNTREAKVRAEQERQERKAKEKEVELGWQGSLRPEIEDGGFQFGMDNAVSQNVSKKQVAGKARLSEMRKEKEEQLRKDKETKQNWQISLREKVENSETAFAVDTKTDEVEKKQRPSGKEYREKKERHAREEQEMEENWMHSLRPNLQ